MRLFRCALALAVSFGVLVSVAPVPNASAAGAKPFTFMAAGFTQELYGTGLQFAGGVAFAPDGDPLVAYFSVSRMDAQTTTVVHGSTIHPTTSIGGSVSLGLANGNDGSVFANTSGGVVKIDPATGATLAGPAGPGGDGLGIALDPQTGNLVYANQAGGLSFVTANLSSSGSFSSLGQGDGLAFDPTGNFAFSSVSGGIDIINRSGALVRHIVLASGCCTDGMAFHSATPKFVLSNNTDGTMTRFDFANDDYTQVPTQSTFASGGFRGDLAQVGSDTCLYVVQSGTRFDDGTETGEGSLVRICPGFAPPVGATTCPPNYTVQSGQSATLTAKCPGNVTVQPGGNLRIVNSTIGGNVTSNGAAGLTICGSTIGGAVSVSGSTGFVLMGDGGDEGGTCAGNQVSGSVTLSSNNAGVEVGGNKIGGKLTLTSNKGGTGEDANPEVEANRVGAVLGCTGNTPAPINDGLPNTAAARSGQCASL
ncbi:MAG: hypothetical protein JWP02_2504 [Acidimicrobiales bacterium]|nr:hypothetical protein [Acidimicrobiales bacterium]